MAQINNNNNPNPLYTSIPLIQRVMTFVPSKKLSMPVKLATVCSSWEETAEVFGGGSLVWLHEAEKKSKKSDEKLVSFFHKACAAQNDIALWIVKQFLQLGIVDPLAEDRAGFQAVHFATRWGNVKILDILLFHHVLYPNAYQDRQRQLVLVGRESDDPNQNSNSNNIDLIEAHDKAVAASKNPQRIVSLYSRITKTNYCLLDLAAETAQFGVIEFLVAKRNFDVTKNLAVASKGKQRQGENAVSHLLKEFDGKFFIFLMNTFNEKWLKSVDLPESEFYQAAGPKKDEEDDEDEDDEELTDPRWKMQEALENHLHDKKNNNNNNNNNGNDGNSMMMEEENCFGSAMFTRSNSALGYIETNHDDLQLAEITSEAHYDSFASIKRIKKKFATNKIHLDKMFVTSALGGYPQLVHWCVTPLLLAVENNRHTAVEYIFERFSDSSSVMQTNTVHGGTNMFFTLISSCRLTFNGSDPPPATASGSVVSSSPISNTIVKIMERINEGLYQRKIDKIRKEKKENAVKADDDDDDGGGAKEFDPASVRLEPEERVVEKRSGLDDSRFGPTPFLHALKVASGVHCLGLLRFLVERCGANPFATETIATTDGTLWEADAFCGVVASLAIFSSQKDFLMIVKYLVSLGLDPERKTGPDNTNLIDKVEAKLAGEIFQNYQTRNRKPAECVPRMKENLKIAIEEGIALRKIIKT
jgi:hypothetical protein